jgi:hypothetical protein
MNSNTNHNKGVETMTLSNALFSNPCAKNGICRNPDCEHAVIYHKSGPYKGGWFITFGHAGFNSPTNNASGYRHKETAIRAMKWYLNR